MDPVGDGRTEDKGRVEIEEELECGSIDENRPLSILAPPPTTASGPLTPASDQSLPTTLMNIQSRHGTQELPPTSTDS